MYGIGRRAPAVARIAIVNKSIMRIQDTNLVSEGVHPPLLGTNEYKDERRIEDPEVKFPLADLIPTRVILFRP